MPTQHEHFVLRKQPQASVNLRCEMLQRGGLNEGGGGREGGREGDKRVGGWEDGWEDGWEGGEEYGWVGEWVGGRVGGRKGGWEEGRMGGREGGRGERGRENDEKERKGRESIASGLGNDGRGKKTYLTYTVFFTHVIFTC